MTTIKNILNKQFKLSIIIIFSISAILMTGCSKDEDLTPIPDPVALSQHQILQSILDANPGNTLDWDLQNTKDVGALKGITTNAQGDIIKMDIQSARLSQLPSQLGLLKNLKSLICNQNRLTTIPLEIGQLTNLTFLTFHQNSLITVPPEIGKLIKLKFLALSTNKITTIPSEIGQLTNLTFFNIRSNEIIKIPSEVGHLTNLEKLYMNDNKLTSIPSQIGKLTRLKQLTLDENLLKAIPVEIGFLTNLNMLRIHDNQLTSIPQAICYLQEYNNPSMDFKKDIGSPCEVASPKDALIGIYSSNPKNTLDWHAGSFSGVEFGGHREIKKINIRNKGIEHIPKSVSTFKLCELLDLRDNPLSFIDLNVCALKFTSKVRFRILTDSGEGCN